MKKILLVDKKDNVIGTETVEKCHERDGILHRGISILIFNKKNEVLITKRSKSKKLWPLYWDNSSSTHPYPSETYEKTGERRLLEELGFTCSLRFLFKFMYQAKYKNVGSENEMCAVLIGKYNDKIKPNSKEIDSWKWMDINELRSDIIKNPNEYTPWLKIGLKKFLKHES